MYKNKLNQIDICKYDLLNFICIYRFCVNGKFQESRIHYFSLSSHYCLPLFYRFNYLPNLPSYLSKNDWIFQTNYLTRLTFGFVNLAVLPFDGIAAVFRSALFPSRNETSLIGVVYLIGDRMSAGAECSFVKPRSRQKSRESVRKISNSSRKLL